MGAPSLALIAATAAWTLAAAPYGAEGTRESSNNQASSDLHTSSAAVMVAGADCFSHENDKEPWTVEALEECVRQLEQFSSEARAQHERSLAANQRYAADYKKAAELLGKIQDQREKQAQLFESFREGQGQAISGLINRLGPQVQGGAPVQAAVPQSSTASQLEKSERAKAVQVKTAPPPEVSQVKAPPPPPAPPSAVQHNEASSPSATAVMSGSQRSSSSKASQIDTARALEDEKAWHKDLVEAEAALEGKASYIGKRGPSSR
eukprot:gnl/TRDRNA2_/TRDRNA2_131533_c0_seq3.p1 gnl/TRDRNA2_/TRDRNA2_131533_c0~~gnl/TRDRNA2_/TRDRNA2_131533_c0_seq3.p1  ORF type:complete len:264 (+),score=70.13 gnl/TRDRNA2_/TRDRNA2_131533_c0_seq3:66-857(+)